MKKSPPEVIIFTKFYEDWAKIVDFLLMADFERVLFFFPRTLQDSEILLCKILLTSIYAVCKRLCFNIILPKNTKF